MPLTFLQIPLSDHFSEYAGGPDVQKAAKFILWKFTQENKGKLSIYPQCVSPVPWVKAQTNQNRSVSRKQQIRTRLNSYLPPSRRRYSPTRSRNPAFSRRPSHPPVLVPRSMSEETRTPSAASASASCFLLFRIIKRFYSSSSHTSISYFAFTAPPPFFPNATNSMDRRAILHHDIQE
jgi:hypothetical protein